MDTQIIALGRQKDFEGITKLLTDIPIKNLIEICTNQLNGKDVNTMNTFLNFLLIGFSDTDPMKHKRYLVVKTILQQLNKIELSTKQIFYIIRRICIDLSKFDSKHLIEFAEYCIDSLKIGDPKCIGWKDLLPEIIVLINDMQKITVNDIQMNGKAYKEKCIQDLCTMKWPTTVLTSIANMFRELPLTKDERLIITRKICINMKSLDPLELPPLAYQLFLLCNDAFSIFIPITKFHKYFYKHHYGKLIDEHSLVAAASDLTDYDSIDRYSTKELREAEETILYHLSKCTEFQLNENEIITSVRELAATPQYILKPFVFSAMLTMSYPNRYPDATKISSSNLLIFLRNVIRNNEMEREFSNRSAWCRDTLNRTTINMNTVLLILIDQSKDGQDIITAGLINLAFILLKTPNNENLNNLGIDFLKNFIKKRFIFGKGIVQNLKDLLLVNYECKQYIECFIEISLTNRYTLSECTVTIKSILDYLLLIPGEYATRFILFIFPLIKLSCSIQEYFIDVLNKAMCQRELSTMKMAVYGFCEILKLPRNGGTNRNTQRSASQRITGFSLMTQSMTSSSSCNSVSSTAQKNIDFMLLEIFGILRKCFNQPAEIKCTLYEGLSKAILFNGHQLIPLIFQFIEWHFQSYFNINELNLEIHYERIVREQHQETQRIIDGQIEVCDHLGKLINLIGNCIISCDKYDIACDTKSMKKILESLIDRIDVISIEQLGIIRPLDEKMHQIGKQFLNTIEALMSYGIRTARTTADYNKILKLYRYHAECLESLKKSSVIKKVVKKSKNKTSQPSGIIGRSVGGGGGGGSPNVIFKCENCWETNALVLILQIMYIKRSLNVEHDQGVDQDTQIYEEQINPLYSNSDFRLYVLHVTSDHIERFYNQKTISLELQHSKMNLRNLQQITRIIYCQSIKCLPTIYNQLKYKIAVETVHCFLNCLTAANELYRNKFDEFIKSIDGGGGRGDGGRADGGGTTATTTSKSFSENIMGLINGIHKILESFFNLTTIADDEADDDEYLCEIIYGLLKCLEILYRFIETRKMIANNDKDKDKDKDANNNNNDAATIYNWLYKMCHDYEMNLKKLDIIHKLLFEQRIKAYDGEFFNSIAIELENLLGQIEKRDIISNFNLKSITTVTVGSCILHLCAIVRRQIDDIEYFITKAKSFYAKMKFDGLDMAGGCIESMKTIELKICLQLYHIANTLIHLTNTKLPLGIYMETVIRLLTQFYICISALTKHFIVRCPIITLSFAGTKFDQLIRIAGRPLALNIHRLITYTEHNIFNRVDMSGNHQANENDQADESGQEPGQYLIVDAQLEKQKVIRETRSFPKLILHIEYFNKFILLLSKKCKIDLSKYLHIGTVRDFRLITSTLRDELNRTQQETQNIEIDEDNLDGNNNEDTDDTNSNANNNNNDNNDEINNEDDNNNNNGTPSSGASGSQIIESDIAINDVATIQDKLIENITKINERAAKKRKLRSTADSEQSAVAAAAAAIEGGIKKKRIGRKATTTPMVTIPINKSSLRRKK